LPVKPGFKSLTIREEAYSRAKRMKEKENEKSVAEVVRKAIRYYDNRRRLDELERELAELRESIEGE